MPDIGLYNWLSTDPPILWHSASGEEDVGHCLPDERIYRLVMNLWHQTADEIEAYHQRWRSLKPQHRLLHLVNDSPICEELQSRGIPAVFVNQNSFLDETKFTIQPDIPKTYDAVYNARMTPWKRHHLLSDVSSPLVIGGLIAEDDSQVYFDQVRDALPRATFTHAPPSLLLHSAEVSEALNSAQVGVCLSAVEGTMFAATEYMLCGLPVVSTPSLGGRETWFDPRFTRIVPPEPAAIAAAVRELISLNISPHLIRNATIARMSEHRHRFTQAVQKIFTSEGSGRDFAREFYTNFRHKCGTWRANREVMQVR
jgi:glycosyltransferase involved in cell wall biosynthesis